MREMKDSGVEWIGEIPSNKRLLRNKYKLTYTKGKLPSETNSERLGSPYIGATDLDSATECSTYTQDDTLPEAQTNDLLVLWDGARAGLCGTNRRGKISSTIMNIKADHTVYAPFLFWYYKSLFKKVINSHQKQKCTPAKNGKMEVPLPPSNQRREVHFYGFAA